MMDIQTSLYMLPDNHLDVWLTEDRMNDLRFKITNSLHLLLASNTVDNLLNAWCELEVFKDLANADKLLEQLDLKELSLVDFYLDPSALSKHRMTIIYAWAYQHWSNKLESLYLEKKDSLEKLSFSLINLPTNELAYEIFYRLSAGEAHFIELYDEYNLHRQSDAPYGQYKSKPITMFPKKMHPVLRRLKSGQLLKPFQNGDFFSVIIMNSWHVALFDKSTKDLLLYNEFLAWQREIVESIKISSVFN